MDDMKPMAKPSHATLQKEADRNYAAIRDKIPELMKTRKGQIALLRHGEIVDFFPTMRAAYIAASNLYPDGVFSTEAINIMPVINAPMNTVIVSPCR